MSPERLIAYVCDELVGDAYTMQVTEGEGTLLVELTVLPRAMPYLVGRHGRMVDALKALAIAAGRKHGIWVYLTLDQQHAAD